MTTPVTNWPYFHTMTTHGTQKKSNVSLYLACFKSTILFYHPFVNGQIKYAHQNPLNLCGDLEHALTSIRKTPSRSAPNCNKILTNSCTTQSTSRSGNYTYIYIYIITVQILLSNQSVILLINTHHTEQLYVSEVHIGHRGSFPLFSFYLSPPTPHHIYVHFASVWYACLKHALMHLSKWLSITTCML